MFPTGTSPLPVCVLYIFFGDRIGRFFYGDAIAAHLVAGSAGAGLAVIGSGGHQVVCDGTEQLLNAIPARGIAFGVKLLFALDIVDVEDVIPVAVTIIYFRVGDAR